MDPLSWCVAQSVVVSGRISCWKFHYASSALPYLWGGDGASSGSLPEPPFPPRWSSPFPRRHVSPESPCRPSIHLRPVPRARAARKLFRGGLHTRYKQFRINKSRLTPQRGLENSAPPIILIIKKIQGIGYFNSENKIRREKKRERGSGALR